MGSGDRSIRTSTAGHCVSEEITVSAHHIFLVCDVFRVDAQLVTIVVRAPKYVCIPEGVAGLIKERRSDLELLRKAAVRYGRVGIQVAAPRGRRIVERATHRPFGRVLDLAVASHVYWPHPGDLSDELQILSVQVTERPGKCEPVSLSCEVLGQAGVRLDLDTPHTGLAGIGRDSAETRDCHAADHRRASF